MTKGELTRQRIIEEAAPLFNQRGYTGCSMQDIMEATGMEKGGLYRHFANKEELAAEAFRFALANSVRIRTQNVEHISGAIAKLRYVVKRFTEGPSSMPGGCPLMNAAIDSDDGNPMLRRLVAEGIQDWKKRISAIVQAGIQQGEIHSSADPRRIANTLIAALEGALMISRIEGNKTALRDIGISLELVVDGLATAPQQAALTQPRSSRQRSPSA